jgi:hypothetical protein
MELENIIVSEVSLAQKTNFYFWFVESDSGLLSSNSHTLKFSSSLLEPGGAGSFSRVTVAPSEGYKTLVSGVDSINCLTTQPLGDTGPAFKYHKHKTEDSDTGSDSNSEGEEYEGATAHQLKETLHLEDHPWPPIPESHGSPLQKALL